MNYLIDGHNLIARLPGLSLADPDDEAKLVQFLKRWVAADARRKVTVVFDAGLPGGPDRHLSGGGVRVVFASTGSSADAVLIRRLEQVRNPQEYIVVSSDQAIVSAAQRRRVAVQRSEAFAAAMLAERTSREAPARTAERPDAPALSPNELAEWLALFGPEPEPPTRPRRPRNKPGPLPKKPPK